MKIQADNPELHKLSVSQKDFLFDCFAVRKKSKDADLYVIGICYYDDSGNFDPDSMEKAYVELLRRNDAFRMRIIHSGFKVRQCFQSVEDFPIPQRKTMKDINSLLEYCNDPEIPIITMWDEFLTRAEIYSCEDGCGGIIIWQHHICSDGYSLSIVAQKELSELYSAYKNKIVPEKPGKLFLFTDYLKYEQKLLSINSAKYKELIKKIYHKNVKNYRVPVKSVFKESKVRVLRVDIKGSLYETFDAFCKKSGCSDTVLIMSAVAFLVNRITNAKRFMFTMETHGRTTFVQKMTSGPLLYTNHVFFDFSEPDTIETFVEKIGTELFKIIMYEHFTFLQVAGMSLPNYFYSRSGFFDDEWMSFNNMRSYKIDPSDELKNKKIEQKGASNAFDISILDNDGDGIQLLCQYSTLIVTEERMKELSDMFIVTLEQMLAKPDRSVIECIDMI